MIKHENTQYELSDAQKLLLTNIEFGVQQNIKKALNTISNGQNLSVYMTCKTIDWIGKSFIITGNSSVSINGSYSVSAGVNDYLNKQDLSSLKEIATFEVVLDYSIKEKSSLSNRNTERAFEGKEETPQFISQKPKCTFEQLILPEETKDDIFSALNVINSQDLIYNQWGYAEIDSIPRSILNFYGPPGTGKTMCAHAIAHQLKRKLLALNYSEIESKYVGEAAKNLSAAFDQATKENDVLFFDEADSFLGKRIENVTQGSDQALNSLRSQMLILLECFSGVVIFATNLVTNFDVAFESRILKHIKFELPNKEARAAIISKTLPPRLPLEKPLSHEDLLLASAEIEGLSGREIKSAILEMLLYKANKEGATAMFSADDIFNAMKKKKVAIDKLKAEESERRKMKIMKRLAEKVEEGNMEKKIKNGINDKKE